MRLPEATLSEYCMEPEYLYLTKDLGYNDQQLKEAWELGRRLDLLNVCTTYTLEDVKRTLEIVGDRSFLELFTKIHRSAEERYSEGESRSMS